MVESAYVSDLKQEVHMKFNIAEHQVSLTRCWIEREDGTKIGTTTLIKTLLQEKQGTADHPLILIVPTSIPGVGESSGMPPALDPASSVKMDRIESIFKVFGITLQPEASEAFETVLVHKTEKLQQLGLTVDQKTTTILEGLRTAKEFNLPAEGESLVSGVTVSGVELSEPSVLPSTIFIRKFYPDLLKNLLRNKYSVLTGNPGISKSWFHWYVLYHMVKENDCKFKLIVRQVADRLMAFIFPQCGKVFYTINVKLGLALLEHDIRQDLALLLIEPEAAFTEPLFSGVQTILMCSPDRRHYKEFYKHGAVKQYMPVWKLDELQLVAGHIRENASDEFLKRALTSEEIEKRYNRFGGIFRYVIPYSEAALNSVEREQESVLANAKAVDTFIRGDEIEKRDDNKENSSHFLLQYNVNEKTFTNVRMMIASEFVKEKLDSQSPNDAELYCCIHELRYMFQGGKKENPHCFEYVVFHMLACSLFMWTVYKDGQGWVKRDFKFSSTRVVARYEEEDVLKNMQTGVLYYPVYPQFPAVDQLWVEENDSGQREYFSVQVTFAQSHTKSKTVYEKLYASLGLKKEERVNVYVVPNPKYAETYAKLKKEQFFTPQLKSSDEFSYNLNFATLRSEEFEKNLRLQY